jgi:probable HAF family extracellular repeat protein
MSNRHVLRLAAAAAVLCGFTLTSSLAEPATTSPSASAETWVIRDLPPLPGDRVSWSVAINARGQVLLNSSRSDALNACHAFVWQNGTQIRLGTLGGTTACASAINDHGDVTGWSTTKTGARHAFLWRAGRMRDLGTLPGGRRSSASALNEHAQVVGWSTIESGARHAFLWQNGRMRDLGTLGGRESWAGDINERGQIVGSGLLRRNAPNRSRCHGDPRPPRRGFLWRGGRMTSIGTLSGETVSDAVAITDSGFVLARATWNSGGNDDAESGFVWRDGQTTFLATDARPTPSSSPCHDSAWPTDISERGDVVGMFAEEPALWQHGRLVDVTSSGFSGGAANGVNDSGDFVGWDYAQTQPETMRAFVWSNGNFTDLGIFRGHDTDALAVNDQREILGQAGIDPLYHGVLWTPAVSTTSSGPAAS